MYPEDCEKWEKSSDEQIRSAVLKTSTCQRLERPLTVSVENSDALLKQTMTKSRRGTPEQSSDERANADSNLFSEGRQPDEWQCVRQPEGNPYVKHAGDKNLQAEQEEMPVEKIHSRRGTKESGKGPAARQPLQLSSSRCWDYRCYRQLEANRRVMVEEVRIPQPHNCPRIGEGIVRRAQATVATTEHQRAKAILCTETIRRVCTKAIPRIVLSLSDDATTLRAPTVKECWLLWKEHEINGIRIHPLGTISGDRTSLLSLRSA
uniref:Uncharacterized protein n=1 Tax=Toxocara canis TaxID=6265 RepID=A0A183VE19_TOXCA